MKIKRLVNYIINFKVKNLNKIMSKKMILENKKQVQILGTPLIRIKNIIKVFQGKL